MLGCFRSGADTSTNSWLSPRLLKFCTGCKPSATAIVSLPTFPSKSDTGFVEFEILNSWQQYTNSESERSMRWQWQILRTCHQGGERKNEGRFNENGQLGWGWFTVRIYCLIFVGLSPDLLCRAHGAVRQRRRQSNWRKLREMPTAADDVLVY